MRSWVKWQLVYALFTLAFFNLNVNPALAASEKVKLVIGAPANTSGAQERMQAYLAEFYKEHPNIEVELQYSGGFSEFYERTAVQHATGTAPDLINMAVHWLFNYAESGVLMPLDHYIERDGVDLGEYFPDAINIWRWSPGSYQAGAGSVYTMPFNWQTSIAFYYNQDIFDRTGTVYPDETWTWDTFVDAGRKFTVDSNGDGEPDQWGTNIMQGQFDLYTRAWQAGGELINEDYSESLADTSEVVEAIRWLAELNTTSGIARGGLAEFEQGKLATLTTGQWNVGLRFPQTIGDDFRYDLAPPIKHPVTGSDVVQAHSNGWGISASTKHPDEAWALVKFLTTEPGLRLQAELHSIAVPHIPVAREFLYVRDREIQPRSFYVVADSLLTARQPYVGARTNEVWSAHAAPLREAVQGLISPEEAALRMKDAINAILQDVRRTSN